MRTMNRRGALLAGAAAAFAGFAPALTDAQSAPDASAAPPDPALTPLGIGLEGYPYPHPVAFHQWRESGQDVRMAYMDVVPNGAPRGVALLMHGRNFPAGYWEPVIASLVAAGYRVIVPDQLAFGKSSKAELTYTFDLWARSTLGLLDALQIPRLDLLIGHSIGGIMATKVAHAAPQRVARLLLQDPLALEDYRVLVPEVTDAFLYDRELHMNAAGYRAFLASNYFPTWRPAYEEFVTIRRRMALSADYPQWVRVYIQSYQQLHRSPIAEDLRALPMPVQFVVGELDNNAPGKPYAPEAVRPRLGHNADLARAIVPAMRHARIEVIPGVGHVPHLEVPERFNAIVAAFAASPVNA
jgi:pimeloyl-ACP methyl ester carboxylesterase